MPLICILGRQPALGLAELESRFGADCLSVIPPDIAQLDFSFARPGVFEQFGGIQKTGEIISVFNDTDWNKLSAQLKKVVPDILKEAPGGKITLGISAYGLGTNPAQINATALSLKKTVKQAGRPARIVPNKEVELNTAQVLHNKLALPNGIELLLVRHGSQTIIARTIWVQDIEAYRRRDQERPMRDARIGMLPPKLAQIIINLAIGRGTPPVAAVPAGSLKFNEAPGPQANSTLAKPPKNLVDPFCGTGVILQEALLMELNVRGTDLEPRMAEYSQKNLEWLKYKKNFLGNYEVEVADATKEKWKANFDLIACETYLGRPLSSQPDTQTLIKIIHDCNVIHKKFLQNVALQTASGFRMCLAVPAWRAGGVFKRLPILDHLEELGYNRVRFLHAKTSDLVYHREGQIVARELVVLTRK